MSKYLSPASADPNIHVGLVREILAEEEANLLGRKAVKDNHTCKIKNQFKNFIRKLRGLEKVNYTCPDGRNECCHGRGREGSEQEKQLLCLVWFSNFQALYASKYEHLPIDTEELFRVFVKVILSDKKLHPTLMGLSDFAREHDLLQKIEKSEDVK